MCAYSLDLRERVLGALDQGLTRVEVARIFGISNTTIGRYRRQYRETGQVQARTSPGRPPRIPAAQHPALLKQLQTYPDATLEAHCQHWEASHGVRVSVTTMCRAIQRLNWSYKKDPGCQ